MKKASGILFLCLLTAYAYAGLRCNACSRPIEGPYVTYNGLNFHQECYQRDYGLVCDLCNRPITGTYAKIDGKNLHEACFNSSFVPHCHICKAPILGEYTFNEWGDTVHATHLDEYATCEYCGRLTAEELTGKSARYRDGREVCGICYATAVRDESWAEGLLDTARTILNRYGIVIDQAFDLEMVDKHEMSEVNSATGREAWGYTEYKLQTSFFGLIKTNKMRIYALTGMPRAWLIGVLAHELMHVWLFGNGPLDMDQMLNEGSCEYAAYLVLKEMPDVHQEYYLDLQRTNDDLVYGGGFRAVSGYVTRVGLSDWLTYLREHQAPPWN